MLKPSSMITGTGPLASAGVVSVRSMFTCDVGIGGVVDVADQGFGDHGHVAVLLMHGAHDLPCDLGQICRRAAQDLAIEELNDLRASLRPPLWRS